MAGASRLGASRLAAAVLTLAWVVFASPVVAQRSGGMMPGADGIEERLLDYAVDSPDQIVDVTVEDMLGEYVDGSITLTNSEGEIVRLSDYFADGKPIVVAMVYYSCPVVCPVTLQKLGDGFNNVEFTIGDDYRVVIVSFNAAETPEMAASVKENNLIRYGRPVTQSVRDGYTFHVATEGNAKALGDQIGFKYKPLPNGEYSHPVTTVFLTPEGRISRYIHGFEMPKRDVELALLEASSGTIAKDFGHFVAAFCYRFDPASGSYALSAFRVMQLGGIVTVVFLGVLIGGLLLRERASRRARTAGGGAMQNVDAHTPARSGSTLTPSGSPS